MAENGNGHDTRWRKIRGRDMQITGDTWCALIESDNVFAHAFKFNPIPTILALLGLLGIGWGFVFGPLKNTRALKQQLWRHELIQQIEHTQDIAIKLKICNKLGIEVEPTDTMKPDLKALEDAFNH